MRHFSSTKIHVVMLLGTQHHIGLSDSVHVLLFLEDHIYAKHFKKFCIINIRLAIVLSEDILIGGQELLGSVLCTVTSESHSHGPISHCLCFELDPLVVN